VILSALQLFFLIPLRLATCTRARYRSIHTYRVVDRDATRRWVHDMGCRRASDIAIPVVLSDDISRQPLTAPRTSSMPSAFHQVPSSHSGRHVKGPISRYFRWAHQVCILLRISAISSNKIGLPFSARVGVRENCFRRPELAGQLARVRVISWLGWWREEAH
jgi:hypothetical protein